MRKLTGSKIVLATHNKGKLSEIQVLLEPFGIECVSAGDLGLEEPEETETTFVGNARLKAHFAARASGLPALSDDSGISVDALGGAPGVYTADWAETRNGRDFSVAMSKVWEMLQASSAPPPIWRNLIVCFAWLGLMDMMRFLMVFQRDRSFGQLGVTMALGLILCFNLTGMS